VRGEATIDMDKTLEQVGELTGARSHEGPVPVQPLPCLDAAERERILVDFNNTGAPLPPSCVHELVAAQAERTPNARAVRFGRAELSYAELVREARRLAQTLAGRGVRRGDRVALCVERGVQVVVGMLGILEAGAAYVPVDPGYPRERVQAMIAQSQARCAVTQSRFRDSLLADIDSVICFDGDAGEFGGESAASLPEQASPDDLAYVIFTSGSTGAPKGVEIRHVSLVNHGLAIGANYALAPGDRTLCSASIGFDIAGEQIYPALFRGAAVVIRPEDLLESYTRFEAFARQEAITAMILPTAFWHAWVREMHVNQRCVPETLRVLSVGTEKALGEHLATFQALADGRVRFFQGYGPTETTVTCTMYAHDGAAFDSRRPLPIGRPLPNTEIYVLDHDMKPVPVGIEGEIFVGGIGLARGYAGNPELTRERFIEHPFAAAPGARLYKTGDLGYFLPDGQLVYVGRSDFQVKIRGYRVELGEIENVIRAAPGVDECVVILREDTPGAQRLVAYVVAREGEFDLAAIEALCAARLPKYMVPSAILRLSAFPLTPNLKIDRRALPAPASVKLSEARPLDSPSSPTSPSGFVAADDVELVVANAFAEALGVSGFAPEESFFALGGDSMAAVLVLERIRAVCSKNVALGDFFAAPSVAGLAAMVRDGGGVDKPTLIELKPGQGGVPFFLVCGLQIYADLARAIDTPGPVYAVLLPFESNLALHGGELPPVPDLAAQYLAVIRQRFPKGPYALGGVSFGGAVAYEMARQLVAGAAQVPVLVMFDTNLPRARLRGARYWLARKARAIRSNPWSLVKQTLRRLLPAPPAANDQSAGHLNTQRRDAYRRALREYDKVVRPYPGQADLVRAFQPDTHLWLGPDRGWAGLVGGGLTFHDYQAEHLGILRPPNVADLGRQLSRRLKAAAQEPPVAAVAKRPDSPEQVSFADERISPVNGRGSVASREAQEMASSS
jgi:amino acid adenylation domain-containing protein